MAFTIEQFVALRPRLFHLTARMNVAGILGERRLAPTSEFLERAGRMEMMQSRRREGVIVSVDGKKVHLRDQAPLHEGNVRMDGSWGFGRLVEELNSRVFFWPGRMEGPITSGKNHFGRYRDDDVRVLVIDTASLFAANAARPEFCRFNSGSPRWNAGRAAPRGPKTFVPASSFEGTAGGVIEVTFRTPVTLKGVEVLETGVGEWVD